MPYLSRSNHTFSPIVQFKNTLKELSITNHPVDLPISQLLYSLPSLTHLTVLLNEDIYHHPSKLFEDNEVHSRSRANSLIYLQLDLALHFDQRVIPVLRQCPELKALSLYSAIPSVVCVPDNLHQIFQLCPRLCHFAWNIEDTTHMSGNVSSLNSNHNSNTEKGIREFMLQGDISDISKVANILEMSRNTLESLTLINIGARPNRWNTLTYTPFPRLATLSLRYLSLPENEWEPFFACRPNLDKFMYYIISLGRLNLDSMVKGISSLKYLKDLRIIRPVNNIESDLWNNAHMLSNNISLQHLQLTGINFADDVLLDLSKIESVTELSLSFSPHVNHYITFDGLLKFTESLRAMNCRIEVLTLGGLGNINDTVLQRLGDIQSLSMLSIKLCKNVTDDGIMSFLRHDARSKKIHVLGCPLTSRSGLWASVQ